MEASSQSSSQQILWKDVEAGKEKKAKYHTYQRVALVLALLFLVLALCVFSLRYLWSPSLGKGEARSLASPSVNEMEPLQRRITCLSDGKEAPSHTQQDRKAHLYNYLETTLKVYDHQYKAVLDGVERDGLLEIDPGQRIEIFRMGNGSEEVLEVHDFKNGITGIRFAEHQRCYIRTQTRKLPTVAEVEAEDTEVDEIEAVEMKVEDSQVWVPAEEPIVNPAFLFDSKIWEICQELPIHWIHPSPLSDAEVGNEDAPDAEVAGQRFARDVLDHPAVNDYRDVGIELDNRLDDNGYCCQHCRRGYRYCRRYHEPLGGFNPWPYYYQGGRVICQIVMPCNWWIARMLGRI